MYVMRSLIFVILAFGWVPTLLAANIAVQTLICNIAATAAAVPTGRQTRYEATTGTPLRSLCADGL